VFYILYIWYVLCICVCLKATIRACHEPGASCSEFMSLFSHNTVSVFLNKLMMMMMMMMKLSEAIHTCARFLRHI